MHSIATQPGTAARVPIKQARDVRQHNERQRFGRRFDEASNQPLKAKRKTRDDERGDEPTNRQRTTVAASFPCSVGDDERHGEPVRTL